MRDTLFSLQTYVAVRSEGIETINLLFQALHEREIQYCHWKSNIRLEDSLQGKTDLDLLVSRDQSEALKQILLEQNIKQITPPTGQQYPGMEHYLGFDPSSGKLFHLHIHYQLVLGEEYIKNFRLPLEKVFLENTRTIHGVNAPVPELEAGLLAIRVLLKYRTRDAIKDVLAIKSPGIKRAFRDEIKWLLGQTNLKEIREVLENLAPILPAEIILELLTKVNDAPRSGIKFYLLQKRLRKAIHTYQRDNTFSATAHYFQKLWARRKSFRKDSPSTGLRLPQGGITIAMLGADGSGKSTLSKEITKWLSWKLDVKNFYLGSKQPSAMSKYLYLVYRIARRTQRTAAHHLKDNNPITKLSAEIRDLFLYLHYLSIGRDRILRYETGSRHATDGSVVVFDRFPVSSFNATKNNHILDGPHIQELSSAKSDSMSKQLSDAEQQIYRKIEPPDAMILLNVSPEVSIQRKPDHQEEIIRLKTQTLAELGEQIQAKPGNLAFIAINADQPFEQVLLQVKREIWKLL